MNHNCLGQSRWYYKLQETPETSFNKTSYYSNKYSFKNNWEAIQLERNATSMLDTYPGSLLTENGAFIPQDIMQHIMSFLPFKSWGALSGTCRSARRYFAELIKIAHYIVTHISSMPPSVIQNAQLYFRDHAIYFSFVDAHGARHQLSWPVWLLQEMSSIKLANSVQTHVDNLPELNEENITFAITETSTRRLVYLLSTTYLLVSAIHNFIRIRFSRENFP